MPSPVSSLYAPARWRMCRAVLPCTLHFHGACGICPWTSCSRLPVQSPLAQLVRSFQNSSLRPLCLNRKRHHRHLGHLPQHTRLDTQSHQRTPHHARGKRDVQTHALDRLLRGFGSRASIDAHAVERLEARVGQDVDSAMVRFEVVDLFAVEESPKVFTDELDRVEGSLGAGLAGGEAGGRVGGVSGGVWDWGSGRWGPYLPLYEPLADAVAHSV